ncbi:MAG TPA: AtzH-like domain-containing protein [Pyrinomonadaceae bacterium]
MLKRLLIIAALCCGLAGDGWAQNANTSGPATRSRTSGARNTNTATKTPAEGVEEAGAQTPTATPTPRTPRSTGRTAAGAGSTDATVKSVTATFNALLDGIRRADVNAVMSIYWNSPQLVLFNNNGTVTRGWEQVRRNRESSYPEMTDVRLEVRDVRVQMLGRDGAVVNCLWTQSQTFRGTPETASGRMTLVFRHIGKDWKAVHLHTSPDAPDPSRLLPSEQTTPTPAPKPTPAPTPRRTSP